MALLVLPWVQAQGQQKAEDLFKEDYFYLDGLEQKILNAAKAQKGKTISQFQIENKGLVDDKPVSIPIQAPKKADRYPSATLFENHKKAVLILGRLNQANPDFAPLAESLATAFFISQDGVAVTNYHVLGEMIHSNKSIDSLMLSQDSSMYYVQNYDGDVFTIEKIMAYSASNDLAIFKVNIGNKRIEYLDLDEPIPVGEKVNVISHPEQNFYFMTEGIVAKNSKLVNPENPKQKQWRMTITADYSVGSSGGPILNAYGKVAGVVSSTSNIYGSKTEKTPLQMVVKNGISVIAINELLKKGKNE